MSFFSRKGTWLIGIAAAVLAWYAASEIATRAWYAAHESKLKVNKLPASGETVLSRMKAFAGAGGSPVTQKDIGSAAQEMLKCSYGQTLYWSSEEGSPEAATVLKWPEGSVVSGVEAMHNPGNCLHAAGWQVGARTWLGIEDYCGATCEVTQWEVARPEVNMLAFSAVFRRFAETPLSAASGFWNSRRLSPVLAGKRDAPVFILLVYLPVGEGGESAAQARFRRLMEAVFCDSQARKLSLVSFGHKPSLLDL